MSREFGWKRFAVFFFFKQKTAYEMRISDWSSDVCSSDLEALARAEMHLPRGGVDCGDLAAQAQVDIVLGVELGALQRYPVFIRGAGQIILRQVRTVAGRVRVGARHRQAAAEAQLPQRSEEHTSELQSLMRISYAVFCL